MDKENRKRARKEENAAKRLAKKQKLKLKRQNEIDSGTEKYKDTLSVDPCPLCGEADAPFLCYNQLRPYYHCQRCDMIFIPHIFRVPLADEPELYSRHAGDAEDDGFKRFISQLTTPLVNVLRARGKPADDSLPAYISQCVSDAIKGDEPWANIGLDYGSGPGPAVGRILSKQGFSVEQYDPYAFPEPPLREELSDTVQADAPAAATSVQDSAAITATAATKAFQENFSKLPASLRAQYAFVTVTEVLKNVRTPLFVWQHLHSLLRPGGVLAVLGGVCADVGNFASWHYHRDPTHVVFYTEKTLRYAEKLFDWHLVTTDNRNLCFFVKGDGAAEADKQE